MKSKYVWNLVTNLKRSKAISSNFKKIFFLTQFKISQYIYYFFTVQHKYVRNIDYKVENIMCCLNTFFILFLRNCIVNNSVASKANNFIN